MKSLLSRWFGIGKTEFVGDFEIFLDGNPSGLNVLIFTEHVNATYFISFDIPLRRMHLQGEINFAVVSQTHVLTRKPGYLAHWLNSFQPDVVIMTRYGHPSGKDILDFFKQRGIPVIYHIDDNLLELPDSLGTEICQRQGSEVVVETRRYLLQNCDLIYASTAYLATQLQSRFPKQSVFYGIYAPFMGDEIDCSLVSDQPNPILGYMGSKGHQHDLELVVPAIVRLLEERPKLRFEVFGTIHMPSELKHFGSRVHHHVVQKSYLEFLSTLAGLGWQVGLAPLVDSPFNQCKAPTKFIEYTACHIPVIASNVPLYAEAIPEKGGVLVDEDWYSAISYFLDNTFARQQACYNARHYCSQTYSTLALQRQLSNIFESVLSKGKK